MNGKYLQYNIVTNEYSQSGSYSMPDLVNGYQVTNTGTLTVRVNGMTLHPGTPGAILGDSVSVGGNEGEIYSGNMEISFGGGVGGLVEVTYKTYYDRENKR